MASTNKTANLELSQFVGTDKPDWLTDYNGDMLKLDTSYSAVSALAEEAGANAESAAASAAQASTDAAAAVADVAGAVSAANAATAAATEATQTAASAISTATAAQSVANAAAGDATSALSIAQNAKNTAEAAQAAAAQAATDAAASAATVQTYADIVPSSASASNKLATMADVASGGDAFFPPDATTFGDVRVAQETGETLSAMLARLFALVDITKITNNTKLYIVKPNHTYICSLNYVYVGSQGGMGAIKRAVFTCPFAVSAGSSYYTMETVYIYMQYVDETGVWSVVNANDMTASQNSDLKTNATYTAAAIRY